MIKVKIGHNTTTNLEISSWKKNGSSQMYLEVI